MTPHVLIEFMEQELLQTPTDFHRYLWDKIPWSDRMIGITGPRGVGKSTMVKQRILSSPEKKNFLYVSADHSYFTNNSIADLAGEFMRDGGKYLVIDEIHKYSGWSRELKQIYDGLPSLNVIFTGSSVLDIKMGFADLSRRALMFDMQGLSFREFLLLRHNLDFPVMTLDETIGNNFNMLKDFHPLPYFREYIKSGYYPFSNQAEYLIRMQQIVGQTMEVDIPKFAGMNMSTGVKLKKMLSLIAELAPYKPNYTNLASELRISKNDVPEYLLYLEKAGMIGQLRDDTGGMRGLGKIEKVYVDNTNLMYAVCNSTPNIGNLRETFFYNQTKAVADVIASKVSDFRIGDKTFEIGGRNKGNEQIRDVKDGYVVKDDIEFGYRRIVPLWQFGLLY